MTKEIRNLTDKERSALYPIILAEYNPKWADWYEDEKARLVSIIGIEHIARIRHYGSTSVPHLMSKPTIDILLEVKNDVDIEKILAAFPNPEYNVMRNTAVIDKIDMVAVKGYTINGFADKVFHIHVREYGEHSEITFRDYLINHPETAAEYVELKRQLQKEYKYNRDGYTVAKGEFIRSVLEKANNSFDNDLLDKIHTTPMGAERIKRNLSLQTDDVVVWCKAAILDAEKSSMIMFWRKGKNWYISTPDIGFTINAASLTIITAHKLKTKIYAMTEEHYSILPEFLYQAIFVPKGVEPPPREIINEPEIFIYIKDFGKRTGDLGLVAEHGGQIVGIAWTRIIQAYGHLDNNTPELAISIFPKYRGRGIGTKLMKKLFELLREKGYKQTSLSVQKNNPAVRFYERLGYKTIGDKFDHAGHEDYLMIKDLNHMKYSEVLL